MSRDATRGVSVSLAEAIAARKQTQTRRGPACITGVTIRALPADEQTTIYAEAALIEQHNNVLTWKDLAEVVTAETGVDIKADRLSRHCRKLCACSR